MAGITRDESDGFAARGCLRYQTKILIPSAFICCRAVHLRAAVIASRYMHVLRGQMPNWWCKWGRPLDPACMRRRSIGLPMHEASDGRRVAILIPTSPSHR
jgi:hypothetical protein